MDQDKCPGPYRATKLWNEAICLFRNGMPLKRHRKHIRLYDCCFTGAEAVSWLHSTLRDNPNFGQNVTREKSFQLLSKFFKVGVFQSVSSGSSDSLEAFKENELYRFCCRSPLRNIQLSSIASIGSQNALSKGVVRSASKCSSSLKYSKDSPPIQSSYLKEIRSRAALNQMKQMEIEGVWKTVVLGRLQVLLGAIHMEDLLPSNQVSGARIMKNVCSRNDHSSYQSFNKSQLFPRWVLAAMRSLIEWPHLRRSACNSIWYPGFEMDIFKVIKDYFVNLEAPLISTFLCTAFINSYAYVEYVESLQEFHECAVTGEECQDMSCPPSKSQENLVLNMTFSDVSYNTSESQPYHYPAKVEVANSFSGNHDDSQKRSYDRKIPAVNGLSSPGSFDKAETSGSWSESQFFDAKKLLSSTLPPNACFETAFTSDSPVTRIIPRKLVENIHNSHKNHRMERLRGTDVHLVPNPLNRQTSSCNQNSPAVSCKMRRNLSAPNLLDVSSSKIRSRSGHIASQIFPEREVLGNRKKKSVTSAKMQSSNSNISHGNVASHCASSVSDNDQDKHSRSFGHGLNNQTSVIRKKSHNDSGLDEKLHHVRNKSGGYVNIALSNSIDESDPSPGFHQLLGEDIDYDIALETLQKLIKCIHRDKESESVLEDRRSDVCGNESCSSASSLWSYHTATSGDEHSSHPNTPAASSHFVPDYISSSPIAEELINSGIQTVEGLQLGVEIFQLLLLLLPPVNRHKLHILLYFMCSVINNGGLMLPDGVCAKSLILDSFSLSILRPEVNAKRDEGLVHRLVCFFLDNHHALFQVPSDLQAEINAHLMKIPNLVEFQAGSRGVPWTYCERMSCEQYEEQKLAGSRLALMELLDQIIMDEKMGSKEKKKRLKMFKEAYPHIYHLRFPCYQKENVKQAKAKRILGFASLSRLKNIRL